MNPESRMQSIAEKKDEFIDIVKSLPEDILAEVRDYTDFLLAKKKNGLSAFTGKIIEEDKELLKRLSC